MLHGGVDKKQQFSIPLTLVIDVTTHFALGSRTSGRCRDGIQWFS